MDADYVAKMVNEVVFSTPDRLIPVRPRRAQVTNVVLAVERQTSCVSWRAKIDAAQLLIFEESSIPGPNLICPTYSNDISANCLAKYYQALCTVTRFPDYRC